MHRVHNLFPADCRADLPLPVAPPSSTTCFHVLVILAFSSSPRARVSSTRSGIRAKMRLKIKSRMEKFWDALMAVVVRFVPVRFAPREFSLAVHRLSIFAPRILKIIAAECIPPHRDTARGVGEAAQISRGESRRVGLPGIFLLSRSFSRPFCANPRSRRCLTTVLQPVRQLRRMQNLGL